MSKQDRLNRILELVIERGSVEVEEAAQILDVSPATIRRDFDALSARQLLNRTHGGASATGGSFNLPLTYKVAKDDEIKKRIAEATLIVSDLQENNLHYFENENLSKLKQGIKDLFVTNTNADAG